jgi:hypothetical protein
VGALQTPDATKVAGFRIWNSLGGFVKREEKGIFILAAMIGRRSAKERNKGGSAGAARIPGRLRFRQIIS